MILSRRTTISLVLGAIGLVLLFVAPLEQKLFEAATGGPPVSGATVLLPVTAPAPTPAPGNSIESSAEQP